MNEAGSHITPRSLAGKTALVTGASRGLGLAITEALVERDVRVAMLARGGNSDGSEATNKTGKLAEEAARLGEQASAIQADVADPDSVRSAFAEAAKLFDGRLDILVINAGVAELARVEDLADHELTAQLDTNLLGAMYCCREAVPLLRAAEGGDVVMISSTTVNDPYPWMAVYAATKAALENYAVSLRRELAEQGTRVTVLRCGPAWTNFNASWDPERAQVAYQEWEAGGYPGWAGAMDPAVVGLTVARTLELPEQACAELLEIDPTTAAPTEPASRT